MSFTKDRHAHLFPEQGSALADRLDAFICGGGADHAPLSTSLTRLRPGPAVLTASCSNQIWGCGLCRGPFKGTRERVG